MTSALFQRLRQKNLRTTRYSRGTACYRSPELLETEAGAFSNKADVWALGCVIFEMITGQRRFSSDYAVFRYQTFGLEDDPSQSRVSHELAAFSVSKLIKIDPHKRLSATRYRRLLKIARFVFPKGYPKLDPESQILMAILLLSGPGGMDIENHIIAEIKEDLAMAANIVPKALVCALHNGRSLLTEELCALGGDLQSALHYATLWGSVSAVQFLVKQNIHINSITVRAETPLDIAIRKNRHTIAEILYEAGGTCFISLEGELWKLLTNVVHFKELEARKLAARVLPDGYVRR